MTDTVHQALLRIESQGQATNTKLDTLAAEIHALTARVRVLEKLDEELDSPARVAVQHLQRDVMRIKAEQPKTKNAGFLGATAGSVALIVEAVRSWLGMTP